MRFSYFSLLINLLMRVSFNLPWLYKIIVGTLLSSYSSYISAKQDTIHIKLSHEFPGYHELFEIETPLTCTLKLDLKEFRREKDLDKYRKAYFIYRYNDSLISKKVRVKSRGVVRKEICSVPPIKLNVQKIKKYDTLSVAVPKIKIVTHCNYVSKYESYLLKEYLTYKIYNLLTPNSFKVRLLNITYIDLGRKNKSFSTWAFMIEPIETLAERRESFAIKINKMGIDYTDSLATDLLSMWHYMIGNTDWSITGRHNIKLIKSKDHTKPSILPIPYDFDYTGLVNADYAIPRTGSGLYNVRERLYMGPCRDLVSYQNAALHIFNKRNEIEDLIKNFEYLPISQRNEMLKYINNFYSSIEKPNFIKYHIDIDCR